VQQVLQALLVLTELKVLPVPLALPEQQMQQISLVFWPSPTVEQDQQHRILWT
jgi:hypothetical protein